MGDRIILHNMIFRGFHGTLAAERELGQQFEVDVELHLDLSRAIASDDLRDTADYSRAHTIAREEVEQRQYQLVEKLAGSIAQRVLDELPIAAVVVRVRKPHVSLPGVLGYSGVEGERRRP
jgi:dihydroneopterin aldolase